MIKGLDKAGPSHSQSTSRVTEAIGALPGVQRVSVDLEPKGASTVHVEAAEPLGDDEVQAALAEEGNYSLLR